MSFRPLSRRTVLRGVGATLGLPWLEAMLPSMGTASAAEVERTTPNRLAFVYVPNGKNMEDWTPDQTGAGFDLKSILKPLEGFQDQLLVLSGLAVDKARANGDGNGDHARAMAAYLTGVQPRKTNGTDIRAGISADQLAASRIGHLTRLPSLEIGCEPAAVAGICDPGYACVYTSTMSWRSETQPLPKEIDPRIVFERLFVDNSQKKSAEANLRRKSVLDFVQESSKSLSTQLGSQDRRKLDEYLSSIRELELRMERADKFPPVQRPDYACPAGIPESYEEHLRIMSDLLVLAFQADVTRVSTFLMANELSNRPYPFIDVADGHHDLSHHQNDAKKKELVRRINIFHTTRLAYLLGRLQSIQEADGTLLDHCMLVYGSGASDGNSHDHGNLPLLVAGGGCGSLKPGRHIRYPENTPLNNLWLSLLDRVDVRVDELGDSNGRLPGLA